MENTTPVQPNGLMTDAEFAALLEAEGFALPAELTDEG